MNNILSNIFNFLLIYELAELFVPIESIAYRKEPATIANTAILSLILIPPIMLLLIFKLHKIKLNKKNEDLLKSMSTQDKQCDPENIKRLVNSLIDVITAGNNQINKDIIKEYVTTDLYANYMKDNMLFDDYEKLSYEMIMAVKSKDILNKSIIVVVNCYKKSSQGNRRGGNAESWKLVENGGVWLLDDITENVVTDYY